MYLTEEEEQILNGEKGEGLRLAMKTLVQYGDLLRAEKLIDISSGHIVLSTCPPQLELYYNILDTLISDGCKAKVPTTLDPKFVDLASIFESNVLKFVSDSLLQPLAQREFDQKMICLGIMPVYSCTNYYCGNCPNYGEHVAYAESSNVIYSNSVIGARTNREPAFIDVFSAILGKTPYCGLHLDENRVGDVLVKVKEGTQLDYPAIGYYLGETLGNKIPLIEGLPKDCTEWDLKNMGAASAASGGLALFHVAGRTPEMLKNDIIASHRPTDILEIDNGVINDVRERLGPDFDKPDLIMFGCPHLSPNEINMLASKFKGKKVTTTVLMFAGEPVLSDVKESVDILKASGVKFSGCCAMVLGFIFNMTCNALGDSGKSSYYSGIPYLPTDKCVEACFK